jgi:hypothetical protein
MSRPPHPSLLAHRTPPHRLSSTPAHPFSTFLRTFKSHSLHLLTCLQPHHFRHTSMFLLLPTQTALHQLTSLAQLPCPPPCSYRAPALPTQTLPLYTLLHLRALSTQRIRVTPLDPRAWCTLKAPSTQLAPLPTLNTSTRRLLVRPLPVATTQFQHRPTLPAALQPRRSQSSINTRPRNLTYL